MKSRLLKLVVYYQFPYSAAGGELDKQNKKSSTSETYMNIIPWDAATHVVGRRVHALINAIFVTVLLEQSQIM